MEGMCSPGVWRMMNSIAHTSVSGMRTRDCEREMQGPVRVAEEEKPLDLHLSPRTGNNNRPLHQKAAAPLKPPPLAHLRLLDAVL